MKVLMPYVKRYRKDAIVAVLAVVVLVFATLWQPRMLQTVMDAIIKNDKQTVLNYGIGLIALAIVGILAGVVNTIFSARLALNVATDLRADMYAHVQTLSFAEIEHFTASNLVVRMTNDINQVQQIVMAVFQQVTRIPMLFIGAFFLAVLTMPSQWWIIVVMMLLVLAISMTVFKRLGGLFGRLQKHIESVNTIARENLMGIRVVKSFVQEKEQIKTFSKTSDELTDVTVKIGELFAVLMPLFFFVANMAIVGSVYIVGTQITVHPGYIAAISSFISYLIQILFALINGAMMMTYASRAQVSLRRLKQVFDAKSSMSFPDADKTIPALSGDITFEHVTFRYPGDAAPTLEDVSFTAKAGAMIGIVGATGSGKTTLAQLIARLFDPQEGRVLIGGVDVRDIPEAQLRKTVAYVLQRATLFSGSISGNLRQVRENASEEAMARAARIAQAAEFIERLPERYDAPVEERSANFSGGQKQRLSITRGVIAEPDILILDDATSALDARSEKLVQEALDRDLTETTTVIIAEKISSIIRADEILVLDEGRVVGRGTHEELVLNNPAYQEIYRTQKAKEKEV